MRRKRQKRKVLRRKKRIKSKIKMIVMKRKKKIKEHRVNTSAVQSTILLLKRKIILY